MRSPAARELRLHSRVTMEMARAKIKSKEEKAKSVRLAIRGKRYKCQSKRAAARTCESRAGHPEAESRSALRRKWRRGRRSSEIRNRREYLESIFLRERAI